MRGGTFPGSESSVSMRGVQGRYQTQRILVMVDGRPVNDEYQGAADLRTLPLAGADRVEVVRGLGSAAERLHGQGWARYWLGEDYVRAADAWRAALLLDPGNEWLVGAIKVAEERAEGK